MLGALLVLTQSSWSDYPVGGLVLSLPGTPVEATDRAAPSAFKNWKVDAPSGLRVLIASAPSNPDVPGDVEIAQGLTVFVLGGKGRISTQADRLIKGWPALEAKVVADAGSMASVFVCRTDKRIFMVSASGIGKTTEPLAERVLRSVALSSTIPQGPLAAPGPIWKTVPLASLAASAELPGEPGGSRIERDDKPGVVERRWDAIYGNRLYYITSRNLLEGERPKSPEARSRLLDGLNARPRSEYPELPGAKLSASVLGGEPSRRLEVVTTGPSKGVLLSEATVKDGQVFVVSAIVPSALKDSAEVKRYFAAFRFERGEGHGTTVGFDAQADLRVPYP